jgi:hypothetical protein
MQFLCFLVFLCVVICAVAVSFIATCVLLASRVYVCVRPGRLLCGLLLILVWFVCGRVYFDLFRFHLLSIIIFNFVCSWDTRRWIKSKNTICLILIHHRQNPTKMMNDLHFCRHHIRPISYKHNALPFTYSSMYFIMVYQVCDSSTSEEEIAWSCSVENFVYIYEISIYIHNS